MYEASRVGPK